MNFQAKLARCQVEPHRFCPQSNGSFSTEVCTVLKDDAFEAKTKPQVACIPELELSDKIGSECEFGLL